MNNIYPNIFIKKYNNQYYLFYNNQPIGFPLTTKEDAILIGKWFKAILPLFIIEKHDNIIDIKQKLIDDLTILLNAIHNLEYNNIDDFINLKFFIESLIIYFKQDNIFVHKYITY